MIMKRANLIWTFYASDLSSDNCPSFRKRMIGAIQLSCNYIVNTCFSSMLDYSLLSINNLGDMSWSSNEANCAKKLASAFFTRGICWKLTLSKYGISC